MEKKKGIVLQVAKKLLTLHGLHKQGNKPLQLKKGRHSHSSEQSPKKREMGTYCLVYIKISHKIKTAHQCPIKAFKSQSSISKIQKVLTTFLRWKFLCLGRHQMKKFHNSLPHSIGLGKLSFQFY
jgi:hypothetical protein